MIMTDATEAKRHIALLDHILWILHLHPKVKIFKNFGRSFWKRKKFQKCFIVVMLYIAIFEVKCVRTQLWKFRILLENLGNPDPNQGS